MTIAFNHKQKVNHTELSRAAVLERGADIVIVGRGVTGALDPLETAREYRSH